MRESRRQAYQEDVNVRTREGQYRKERRAKLKVEALDQYGGPHCQLCGEHDVDKLTLDHINGDGGAHRMELTGNRGGGGWRFYMHLKRLGWPSNPPLRVLCADCNRNAYTDTHASAGR